MSYSIANICLLQGFLKLQNEWTQLPSQREKKSDIDIKKAQMLKSFTNKRRSTSIQNIFFLHEVHGKATCAKIQFCRHVQSDLITTSSQWKIWFSYKDKGGFYFKHKVLKTNKLTGGGMVDRLISKEANKTSSGFLATIVKPSPFLLQNCCITKRYMNTYSNVSVSSLGHVILVL